MNKSNKEVEEAFASLAKYYGDKADGHRKRANMYLVLSIVMFAIAIALCII